MDAQQFAGKAWGDIDYMEIHAKMKNNLVDSTRTIKYIKILKWFPTLLRHWFYIFESDDFSYVQNYTKNILL